MAHYTINEVLQTFPPLITDENNSRTPTPKSWAKEYRSFPEGCVTFYPPTRQGIDQFLGPTAEPSAADSLRLAMPAHLPNGIKQHILSEADVTRDFDQNIAPGTALAFSGFDSITMVNGQRMPNGPELRQRSMKSVSLASAKNIDWQFEMLHPHSRSIVRCATGGEMK